MRWSTTPPEDSTASAAVTNATASPPSSSSSSSGVPSKYSSGGHGRVAGGRGDWTAGRRGALRVALDQLGDDGCCRVVGGVAGGGKKGGVALGGRSGGGGGWGMGGGVRGAGGSLAPRRHPEAVPECLLGALLPPVRLTCLPCVFTPGKGGRKPLGSEVQGFPKVGITEAGEVEVKGMEMEGGHGGGDGWEGGWAVSARSARRCVLDDV